MRIAYLVCLLLALIIRDAYTLAQRWFLANHPGLEADVFWNRVDENMQFLRASGEATE
jgi:hypothetical protein